MPPITVLMLYNEPSLPADHPDSDSETDILDTVDVIARSLKERGLSVRRLGISNDIDGLLEGLRSHAPDVVFNLYEGLASWGNTEVYVAGILEWLKIPFTGSPTLPLMLCRSKPLTKSLLLGAGLPTARFFTVDSPQVSPHDLGWPLIVKPAHEDGSIGITQESVVTNQAALEARIDHVIKTYGGSALVEQFIRGREFHVSVRERDGKLEVLPFSEIWFTGDEAKGQWGIISFDAKWRPGTPDYVNSPAKNPADVDPELKARVADVVRKAFRVTGCRDYARIDLRVDAAGNPYILEVNPNPCIGPMGGYEAALISAKVPYNEFTLGLVQEALARGSQRGHGESPQAVPVPDEKPSRPRSRRPKVRPARSTERERLTSLIEAAEEITAFDKELIRSRIDRLTRRNRPEGSALLVASEGFAIVERCDRSPGAAVLTCLYVPPDSRRQGFGLDLLAAAEAFAQANGAKLLQADLSGGIATAAIRRFLTHHGFLQMADIPDFYPDSTARVTFVRYLPSPETEPAPTQTAPAAT